MDGPNLTAIKFIVIITYKFYTFGSFWLWGL